MTRRVNVSVAGCRMNTMLQIAEVFLKLWWQVIKYTGVEVVIRGFRDFAGA